MSNKDIVDILKESGYGVVEGKDAVLAKIDEVSRKPKISRTVSPSMARWGQI